MKWSVWVSSLILSMLSACGGSSSTSPVVGELNGGWCEQPYYQTIIGTYKGNIEFQQVNDANGNEVNNCHWATSLTITGEALLNRCFLQFQLNAVPTQFFIAESSDPAAGQCREDDNRIYQIDDPNDSVGEQELLNAVGFPVLLGVSGHELDPTRGPFFGDESVQAFQIYLFAGGAAIADQIQINNSGFLDLIREKIDAGVTTKFQSQLKKERTE